MRKGAYAINRHSERIETFLHERAQELKIINSIDTRDYESPDIKRGLRNADGTGVIAGVSHICNVVGYYMQDGKKMPMEGELTYRGINVKRLAGSFIEEKRFGYEETAYLLLFGAQPSRSQLDDFKSLLVACRALPPRFTEDMILPAPSSDIMNKLERSVLALYSYDDSPEPSGIEKELKQAVQLVARMPLIVAHAFAAKKHYFDNESLYLHRPQDKLSLSENFLYSIRRDTKFTEEEAHLLDLCLLLHMDHGGGNNSTFSCRVLSSTGTDIYSAIAAAVGSLKGPRHGGANKKVMEMFSYIKRDVSDWKDDDELYHYLVKIISGETGDRSGLIYGMGHAIYTLSDPRTLVLKKVARSLAESRGMTAEFDLFESVERLAPAVFAEKQGWTKAVCANVDMYSGLVYSMLGIPEDLYTPLFAMARVVGWCTHRIEELYNPNKIIRPAYNVIEDRRPFIPMDKRL